MPSKPAPPKPPGKRPAPPKPKNEFGDPADTLYTGGTPLFDERTGKTIPKREHQRRRK